MKMQKLVFVGLSGGVDSSVAALRLLKQGYNVVGVFIKVWHPSWLECNWQEERLDAMRVAAKLHIPFLTCDAEKAYKDDVADYFISEYKAGRTPNPDVMCNKYVKFGAFMQFAEKHGADFIATGHYAQILNKKEFDKCIYELHRGVDENKDQTYFLWTLTQKQLSKTLLPIGDTNKNNIRKEAHDAGLLTAKKKDSQGVCFLGHIDIPEFLSHYTTLQQGNVLNTHGQIIGTHMGALVYTTGQRHGFTITSKDQNRTALYVIDRNLLENTITVSSCKQDAVTTDVITLHYVNTIGTQLKEGCHVEIQTRYRQEPTSAIVIKNTNNEVILQPQGAYEAPSRGQSCVLYTGSKCLGGGIIT